MKLEIFLLIVSLGCFCTVLHYSVYFIQLFNVNCHWTKSGSLYDAVNQWTSPSLDKRPGSESFSTKKAFHIFSVKLGFEWWFQIQSIFKKTSWCRIWSFLIQLFQRCLTHFQQFSCSLMILLFHFMLLFLINIRWDNACRRSPHTIGDDVLRNIFLFCDLW